MATAICYEQDGTESGTIDLPASIFAGKVSEHAVHQAVVVYLANQRQGTVNTRERSDVRGGGRKPYRQKGTGRARAGTIRSPLWRGGGTVFGPHPRDHRMKLTKKLKRLALRSSLTNRASDGAVVVLKSLEFDRPKTRAFADVMKNIDAYHKKTLLVLEKVDHAVIKSARNIPGVRITLADMVTTYDVVWADKLVFTQGAIARMEEVFA